MVLFTKFAHTVPISKFYQLKNENQMAKKIATLYLTPGNQHYFLQLKNR